MRDSSVTGKKLVHPGERSTWYQNGAVAVWNLDPQKPIGSWKVAWSTCRKSAGGSCRLHDFRHTFVSRLGEARVADVTLTALSGWISRMMLERYSHTRNDAKRRAVELLTSDRIEGGSPQNPPQQETREAASIHSVIDSKW